LENVRDPSKLGKKPSGKTNKGAMKPVEKPVTRKVATQDDKLRNWFQSKE
jgi:hypothetical protein